MCVGLVVKVALRTVSFERLSADASAYVDERGNRLDVAWINTRMNSAKMIGYSSRWERPNQGFVGEPVPKTRAITPHEARISVVELRCLPHPAAGWGYLDFRPKAGGKPSVTELCSGRLMVHREVSLLGVAPSDDYLVAGAFC